LPRRTGEVMGENVSFGGVVPGEFDLVPGDFDETCLEQV
jgi:hypothetical protein